MNDKKQDDKQEKTDAELLLREIEDEIKAMQKMVDKLAKRKKADKNNDSSPPPVQYWLGMIKLKTLGVEVFFCERGEIRTLNQRLKRKLRMRFFVLL